MFNDTLSGGKEWAYKTKGTLATNRNQAGGNKEFIWPGGKEGKEVEKLWGILSVLCSRKMTSATDPPQSMEKSKEMHVGCQ